MSPKARKALEASEVIVGYSAYIELVEHLLEGKTTFPPGNGMKSVGVDRCEQVLEYASRHDTALISSGDAGIYGMAGIMLELVQREGR